MPITSVEIRQVEARARATDESLHNVLRSAQVSHEAGSASMVTLEIDAWDEERADFDKMADEVLFPGDKIEVIDVATGTHHGLFTLEERENAYNAEDGSQSEIVGYDGLRRLMKATESKVWQGTVNDFYVLQEIAKEHGMDLDSAPEHFPPMVGDRAKELGITDLEYIKKIAMANGLAMPHVRYDPDTGKEILVMRPISSKRQRDGAYEFAAYRPGASADFEDFRTFWDAGDIPAAVEVIGWDKDRNRPYRVTVAPTPRGAEVLAVDYADIGKRTTDRVKPGKKGGDEQGVLVHLLGTNREQVDTSTVYRLDTGKTVNVKAPAGVKVFEEKGRKFYYKYDFNKERIVKVYVGRRRKHRTIRAKREYREILHTTFAETAQDAQQYALQWMQARLEAYYSCEGSFVVNAGGAGTMLPSQVHKVRGVRIPDRGWYIFTAVDHIWMAEGHQASFSGTRLLVDAEVSRTKAPVRAVA